MIAAIPARYPTRTGRDRRSASAPSRNTQPKMQNPKTRIASAAAEELASAPDPARDASAAAVISAVVDSGPTES